MPLLARSPSTNRKYPPLPVDKLEEEINRRMADDNKLFREEFNVSASAAALRPHRLPSWGSGSGSWGVLKGLSAGRADSVSESAVRVDKLLTAKKQRVSSKQPLQSCIFLGSGMILGVLGSCRAPLLTGCLPNSASRLLLLMALNPQTARKKKKKEF